MLVDSNILVYSLNTKEPKCHRAQQFIQDGDNLIVAQQNIFESIRILTHNKFIRPMTVTHAVQSVKRIIDNITIITPTNKTPYYAFELIEKHKLAGDKIFDAYLVATMISNNIFEIATDNEKDFKKFKSITVVNPFRAS